MAFFRKYWRLILAVVLVWAVQVYIATFHTANFDSDEAVWGLMSQHMLAGREVPLYYYGFSYLGALEAWLSTLFLWLVGNSSVLAMRFGSLIFYLLFLAVYSATITGWFSQKVALYSLLFISVPSSFLLIWTYRPIGAFSGLLFVGWSSIFLLDRTWGKLKWLRYGLIGFLLSLGMWLHPMMVIFLGAIYIPKVLSSPTYAVIYEKLKRRRLISSVHGVFFALSLILLALIVFSSGCHSIVWPILRYIVAIAWLISVVVLLKTVSGTIYIFLRTQWFVILTGGVGVLLGGIPVLSYIYANSKLPSSAILPSCPTGVPRRLFVVLEQVFPVLFGSEVHWWHTWEIVLALFLVGLGIAICTWALYKVKYILVAVFLLRPIERKDVFSVVIALLFLFPIILAVLGNNTVDFASSRYLLLTWLATAVMFGRALLAIKKKLLVACLLVVVFSLHLYTLIGYRNSQYQIITRYDPHYLSRLETVIKENSLEGIWGDYWLSYNLDYLLEERILFVPNNGVNRIPEYVPAISDKQRVGLLFWNDDRATTFATLKDLLPVLAKRSVLGGPLRPDAIAILKNYHRVDVLHVGHWIIWVLERGDL